jgi:hypothetical protein
LPAKILPFNCAILYSFKVKHHFLTSFFSIIYAKWGKMPFCKRNGYFKCIYMTEFIKKKRQNIIIRY